VVAEHVVEESHHAVLDLLGGEDAVAPRGVVDAETRVWQAVERALVVLRLPTPSPPRAMKLWLNRVKDSTNPILPPYLIPHLRARTQILYSPYIIHPPTYPPIPPTHYKPMWKSTFLFFFSDSRKSILESPSEDSATRRNRAWRWGGRGKKRGLSARE
jgi:hypothetical protein